MLLVEIVMPRIISTEYGETPQPVGYTLADCKNYLRRTGDTDDVWIERNSRVAWFQVERYARRLWGSHPDITSRIQIEPNDVLPITVAPLLGVGPINAITNMQRFDSPPGKPPTSIHFPHPSGNGHPDRRDWHLHAHPLWRSPRPPSTPSLRGPRSYLPTPCLGTRNPRSGKLGGAPALRRG